MLDGAGLSWHVERVFPVVDGQRPKPRPEVHLYATEAMGVAPGAAMRDTAHPWNTQGTKAAGLAGAYVARGRSFPPQLIPPDLTGVVLFDVAEPIARL